MKAGQTETEMAVRATTTAREPAPSPQVEAGVLASIISCDGSWCRVSVGGFRGYIEQVKLWGAYKDEYHQ